jgi:hypothetical protein
LPDTIRTLAQLLALFADGQPAGSISPQDLRDLIVTALPQEQEIPYAAVLTWNLTTHPVATVTLTGDVAIQLAGGENGRSYRLAIRQGAGGPHEISLVGIATRGQQAVETNEGGVDFLNIDVTQGQYFGVLV